MRKSLILRQQLRESIDAEIADRTRLHQLKVAALRTARARPLPVGASAAPRPLVLLAHGDSWFDYPLDGNRISLSDTDVIAQLESMGNINPVIQNVSHYGDATTEEMSWPKQQRMIDSLADQGNWLENGKPDAILFSGGGDDVAGNQFCIFLDYANAGGSGLDASRFQEALGMVEASYRDLFLFRDRNAPGVPIFGHCYDFPIPNGVHPICAGPWLLPSLTFAGWSSAQGTGIVHDSLVAFRSILVGLASDPVNKFVLVETQNTLQADDWANELHPYPKGFKKIAQRFVDALRGYFGPNSI
jgi:hypothetical protein